MNVQLDSLASSTAAASAASSGTAGTANGAGSADRFLKLLVAQMENQDPLNPLDNAQVTSQMAQINTVSGIEKLNTTVESLTAQFAQLQAVQGASLVGREVTIAGDRITMSNGAGAAGFELPSAADRVKVEVLNGAGRVLETLDLGALESGRHGFTFDGAAAAKLADGEQVSFRVTATAGAAAVTATPLMRDRVESVSLENNRLRLQTENSGAVDYSAVKAVG